MGANGSKLDKNVFVMIDDEVYQENLKPYEESIDDQWGALKKVFKKQNLKLPDLNADIMGKVFPIISKQPDKTKQTYAVKLRQLKDDRMNEDFDEEMKIMAKLAVSSYVVKLRYIFPVNHILVFIYDYHSGGNLHEFIQASNGGLSESLAARFYLQMGWGLAHAHKNGIVHKNLKPQNVLLDSSRTIARISDFKQAEYSYKFHTGDPIDALNFQEKTSYLAPECLASMKIVGAFPYVGDVWAMGIIMFEMVYGKRPWTYQRPWMYDSQKEAEYIRKLQQPVTSIEWSQKQTSKEFVNFVLRHFVLVSLFDLDSRPKMKDLLLDSFLVKGLNHPAEKRQFDDEIIRFYRIQRRKKEKKNTTENVLVPSLMREFKRRGYKIKREELGHGGFGIVYGGIFQDQLRAVKVQPLKKKKKKKENQNINILVNINSVDNIHVVQKPPSVPNVSTLMIQELTFLQKLKHSNVVELIDFFLFKDTLVITLELAAGGDLSNYLRYQWDIDKQGLEEAEAARFYLQIGRGLQYCHRMGIAHLDLKPGNILMDETRTVCKIIDFGLSKYIYEPQTGEVEERFDCRGTFSYKPPEFYKNYEDVYLNEKPAIVETKADIWTMGTVLFRMVYGINPFPYTGEKEDGVRGNGHGDEEQCKGILLKMKTPKFMVDWKAKGGVNHSFRLFVMKHWVLIPKDRPEMNELLADLYLDIAHSYPLVAPFEPPILQHDDIPEIEINADNEAKPQDEGENQPRIPFVSLL